MFDQRFIMFLNALSPARACGALALANAASLGTRSIADRS
jgi:hypothetical protein